MSSEPGISLTSSSAPASRGSVIELTLEALSQPLKLRLSGPASFSAEVLQRQLELPAGSDAQRIQIHSIGRPGRVSLHCNGKRIQLRFEPSGMLQSIMHDWAPTIGLAVVLALFLRSFAFASYYVPSPSMVGTLYPGDKFIAEKFTTKVLNREPKRGEIVIFQHPERQNETWVKRIIGLPGDLVEVRNGKLWLNNVRFEEDYVDDVMLHDYGPVSVPPGNYFVLGDNRNNSLDSRYWGYLPREDIEGNPVLIFWPPKHAGTLRGTKPGKAARNDALPLQ